MSADVQMSGEGNTLTPGPSPGQGRGEGGSAAAGGKAEGNAAPGETRPANVTGLEWTPHPLLGVPDVGMVEGLAAAGPEGLAMLQRFWREREERIARAEADPFRYGFELDHWRDADEQLAEWVRLFLFVFGGNRSAKSEWAAKRAVEAAVAYPEGTMLVMDESEAASILKVQKYFWRYLPPEMKALNEKRDPFFKVKYSQANGFADQKLVLPNKTEVLFLNYSQNHKQYEGLELGFKEKHIERWKREHPGQRAPHNIGGWCDESMTPPWATLIETRLATRAAKCIWTFAPVHGMTSTIKEKVGTTAKTLRSRPAELLDAKRVHVEGCPPGEMPYLQAPGRDGMQGSRVIYFHSILNPFGGYKQIKLLCESRTSEEIERTAYGFSRDTVGRAHPRFGSVHIVEPEALPVEGANWKITDPAGTRNFATMWARVTPGNPSKVYIYRDWPSAQRFGEWAVPSENPLRFDGDAGPAQRSFGFGETEYKQAWTDCEMVGAGVTERDPHRAAIAAKGGGAESIVGRVIDSRAGMTAHAASSGGSCLVDRFAGIGLYFTLASGETVELGVTAVNELLKWDPQKPFDLVMNSPRLFVSSECHQVIWALSNWTKRDGEKGACKDFADLVRYLAQGVSAGAIFYVRPGSLVARGGGSY